MFELLHKYYVTLNDKITLFQPNLTLKISKNVFETLKIDAFFYI